VEEADKIRTIYDGSIGHQNDHIRSHMSCKTTAPTVSDLQGALHWLEHCPSKVSTGTSGPEAAADDSGTSGPDNLGWIILKADVSKAHRRIKVLRPGWRFQIATNKGKFWVNKVGTYGMASAQYYWGRMAAALLRLCYAAFPASPWQFVYVDDFAWILPLANSGTLSMAILGFLECLGLPLSWKKVELGKSLRWLGFQVQCSPIMISIPRDKTMIIEHSLRSMIAGESQSLQDMQKLVGRLQWASCAWPFLRPWLQPFWAWMAVLKNKGRPSNFLRILTRSIIGLCLQPVIHFSPYRPSSMVFGSSDAGANDTRAAIGGWFSLSSDFDKSTVYWFMEDITALNFPWLYDKGSPQKRIAALEMLATVRLVKAILLQSGKQALTIPFHTDNQGNAFALLANRSRKWPISGLLMELGVSLHKHSSSIRPSFCKRERNEWADQLTRLDSSGFSPDKQVLLSPFSEWLILPKLLELLSGTSGPE
jgi:hypothetical protein